MAARLETPDDPRELVRLALRRYRVVAGAFRYGGLWDDWKLAQEALDAFDEMVDPQPRLFEVEKEEGA